MVLKATKASKAVAAADNHIEIAIALVVATL